MGIKINSGIKRIEVNDEGDYITLNFRDQELPDKFNALQERYSKKLEWFTEREEAIRAEIPEDKQGASLYSLMTEISKYLVKEVDGLIGEGSCRKIFGVDVPAPELFTDLFEQLAPYFEEGFKERAQRMKKYSPARTGNV